MVGLAQHKDCTMAMAVEVMEVTLESCLLCGVLLLLMRWVAGSGSKAEGRRPSVHVGIHKIFWKGIFPTFKYGAWYISTLDTLEVWFSCLLLHTSSYLPLCKERRTKQFEIRLMSCDEQELFS